MKKYVFIAILLLAQSCQGDLTLPPQPADLIESDSMVFLLRELTVMEAAVQQRYQNLNVYYKVMSNSGKAFLKQHGISTKRFEESYEYYITREAELQAINSQVIDSLNKNASQLTTH
jgi:hypothetical protein